MPKAKKYKLFSSKFESETGSKPICAFLSSPGGCRNGDKCKFLHTTSSRSVISSESSVSSESEGEINEKNKAEKKVQNEKKDPPVKGKKEQITEVDNSGQKKKKRVKVEEIEQIEPVKFKKEQNQEVDNSGQKKKKKRRRKDIDSDDEIFAKPKKKANSQKQNPAAPTSSTKKKEKKEFKENSKAVVAPAAPTASIGDAAAVPGFESLSLPISPYTAVPSKDENNADSIEVKENADTDNTSSSESDANGSYPLPTSTAEGKKWQKTVKESQKHPRFMHDFDFDRYKKSNEEAGIGKNTWCKTKPFGPWCTGNPQVIAIDCEMCMTEDPLTGAKDHKALCRVSIINAEEGSNGEVLLDTLVKPEWPVKDYRSRINGITEDHMENVKFTLRHAQAFLMALCSEETVIVGHSVHNDLAALRMEHYCVGDSSYLYKAKEGDYTLSLKDLAKAVLKKDMPPTHDSVNDALTALQCVINYIDRDGNVKPVERSADRYEVHASRLFVHRIPKFCKPSHLSNMFLEHTSIEPDEIEDIEFGAQHGKTMVIFRSSKHASLAFATLEGSAERETSGRLQKKVYLVKGDYIRVRKMAYERDHNKDRKSRNSE